eukprot:1439587-Rhodomonas_salina.1
MMTRTNERLRVLKEGVWVLAPGRLGAHPASRLQHAVTQPAPFLLDQIHCNCFLCSASHLPSAVRVHDIEDGAAEGVGGIEGV